MWDTFKGSFKHPNNQVYWRGHTVTSPAAASLRQHFDAWNASRTISSCIAFLSASFVVLVGDCQTSTLWRCGPRWHHVWGHCRPYRAGRGIELVKLAP